MRPRQPPGWCCRSLHPKPWRDWRQRRATLLFIFGQVFETQEFRCLKGIQMIGFFSFLVRWACPHQRKDNYTVSICFHLAFWGFAARLASRVVRGKPTVTAFLLAEVPSQLRRFGGWSLEEGRTWGDGPDGCWKTSVRDGQESRNPFLLTNMVIFWKKIETAMISMFNC